ncbi:glycosyltransferase [uncultured Christiangramia sp.]|uniref:glycosyltransferase family 2 protein n=1 Tax=Christiangramia sp. 3-2217-3z TaxID=3417564 RepID=UPI00263809F0|nr:glycosyltransferase [uncultured Christiangramia sp.]
MMVSIIIPCYNDPVFIIEAVQSAIDQTYKNKEVIIVDDGSNKETKAVLNSLKLKVNKIITQPNRGLSAARNIGISAANGKFIVVLDSDDFFSPSFCEKAVKIFLENKSEYKVITCYAKRFDRKGVIDIFKPKGGGIENFLFFNAAIGNSLFTKLDWQQIEGYDENMRKGFEDWEFYIRLLSNSGKAYVIKEPLFHYRQKEQSMRKSANKIKYELWAYIFRKHSELYKNNYESMIDFFISKIALEEKEKIKNKERIEYKVGTKILAPIRFIKRLWQ